ncbi:hypothetical protein VPHD249_0105 [Vibrio phage D249]
MTGLPHDLIKCTADRILGRLSGYALRTRVHTGSKRPIIVSHNLRLICFVAHFGLRTLSQYAIHQSVKNQWGVTQL